MKPVDSLVSIVFFGVTCGDVCEDSAASSAAFLRYSYRISVWNGQILSTLILSQIVLGTESTPDLT